MSVSVHEIDMPVPAVPVACRQCQWQSRFPLGVLAFRVAQKCHRASKIADHPVGVVSTLGASFHGIKIAHIMAMICAKECQHFIFLFR